MELPTALTQVPVPVRECERVATSDSDDDDLSSHSSIRSVSVYSEDQDLESLRPGGDVLAVKPTRSVSKTARGLKLVAAVVGVILVLLAVDIFLYFRMEFKVKTIDGVLSEDSPDANVRVSLDVSSRLLFSSIQVNSFTCKAFHKAPYDKEGQYFATVTNNNQFETNTMINGFESADKNFIENMDVLISDIDFEVLKRSLQDSYMTTHQTASRLDCSLDANVNMLGMAYVPAPTISIKFKNDCDDCETQQEFDSTDIFMVHVVGSLISETNTASSRPGEENHKRSMTFSEDSDKIVINVNKEFDISKVLGDIERFNLEVPAAEYVITSKDRDEFWTTTTTPFSVDLAIPGGTRLITDITTSCANVNTGDACHVTDPVEDFLDDVWNGNIKYEMTSSAEISKDDAYGDRFREFSKMKRARVSGVADSGNTEDVENFVESLFGIKFEFDMSLSDIKDSVDDIKSEIGDSEVDVTINRRMSTSVSRSLVLKLSGSKLKLVDVKVDYWKGWPGHSGGGMTTIDLNFYDGVIILKADVNAGPHDMKAVIRSFEMPSQGFEARDGNVEMYLKWHHDSDGREVSVDYVIDWNGMEQIKNSVSISYGIIIDEWKSDAESVVDVGTGFNWMTMDHSADDDDTTSGGDMPNWRCMKLSHDDHDISLVFCFSKGDPRFKLTWYDGGMEPAMKLAGAIDGSMAFLTDVLPHIDDGLMSALSNVGDVEFSAKGAIVIRDDNLFKFVTLKSFRLQSMISRHGFDIFMDLHDRDDNEVVLVRAMTGWKDFYSITDMGVTTTQFLFRSDGYEHLRVDMAEAYVRYKELTDMNMAIDRLSVVIADEEVVDTTLKVRYMDEVINVLWRLFLEEEEAVYLKVEGTLDIDSRFDWYIDMTKVLLRLDGEQRIKASMKGDMEEVDDSSNDMHMGMNMRMFLAVDSEEYMDLKNMNMDIIVNDGAETLSVASRMQGIMRGEDVFNGTLFVDRDAAEWTVSTNNFNMLQALEKSPAPTVAPTVYAYATKTVVEVKSDVKFKTTKNSFQNNPSAQNAAKSAFKKSLNEPEAQVDIDEVTSEFTETRRRRLAVVEGIVVTFKTTIVAERTGQSTSDLYSRMQSSITNAVTSGSFETNLETAFEEFDVAEPFVAERTVVVAPAVVTVIHSPTGMPTSVPSSTEPTSAPSVEPITPFPTPIPTPEPTSSPSSTHPPTATAYPTHMPTHMPTHAPTVVAAVASDGDSGFSTVNIIIIAVVVPVGLLLMGAIAYFVMQEKSKVVSVLPASSTPVVVPN